MKKREFLDDGLIGLLQAEQLPQCSKDKLLSSIDYLFEHNLQALSNDVPDELLDWWLAEWKPDSENANDYEPVSLFVRVFALVMLIRSKVCPEYFQENADFDPQAALHAAELMQYIRTSRRKGLDIPDFDIFDILHYNEIMEMLFGGERKQRAVS